MVNEQSTGKTNSIPSDEVEAQHLAYLLVNGHMQVSKPAYTYNVTVPREEWEASGVSGDALKPLSGWKLRTSVNEEKFAEAHKQADEIIEQQRQYIMEQAQRDAAAIINRAQCKANSTTYTRRMK